MTQAKGSDETRWHVVITKSRGEWMVHRLLDGLGFENLYPHELGLKSHAGRKIAVLKPLYTRMLFVAVASGQSCFTIAGVPGFTGFLTGISGPKVVRPEAIAVERARCDATGLVRSLKSTKPAEERWIIEAIAARTPLRITTGPWEGYWGPLTGVDKHGRAVIELDVFGRKTPLIVPLDWVESPSPKVRSQREIRHRAGG